MTDDDDDSGAIWKGLRQHSQEKRANNRQASSEILTTNGIEYLSRNDGAHLIIGKPAIVNFWPGTGRWNVAGTAHQGFGVMNLITWLRKTHPQLVKGKGGINGH